MPNPKLKSTGAGRYQLLSRWWDAYRKQLGLKDFSPKSQDAVALQQIGERSAYLWSAVISVRHRPLQQYLGFTAGRWLWSSPEHKADSLIAKFKEAAERSERLMYEQSHCDYLRSGYLHHRLPVMGLLIITVITPLPTKPSATKMPENWSWRTRQLLTCRCVSACCCARCKIHEGVTYAKAENDALRDDVAAGCRRLHIKAVCQSVREATTASGVDNAASPWLADTAERDYFTLRERLITKTTGSEPEAY